MKINILGENWNVKYLKESDDIRLKNMGGLCDFSVREIIINNNDRDERYDMKDLEKWRKKTLKHEILHAFLYECGLSDESNWAKNEEMIDFFAFQLDKIKSIFDKADMEYDYTKLVGDK